MHEALEALTQQRIARFDSNNEYLDALPDYPDPGPAYDRALEAAEFEYGDEQVCSNTTYEISDAPQEVVMFNTDPQVFWPGALIQGDSYESGSPLLIPLPNRAPINLTVQGLYADQSSAFDVPATQTEVNQAVQSLLAGAVHDDTPTTQSVFYDQKEAYSFEQAALKLGFSARYLAAERDLRRKVKAWRAATQGHHAQTWKAFLAERAAAGDSRAVRRLTRQSQRRAVQIRSNRTNALPHGREKTSRGTSVHYIGGGARIRESSGLLELLGDANPQAIARLVSLAEQRFKTGHVRALGSRTVRAQLEPLLRGRGVRVVSEREHDRG